MKLDPKKKFFKQSEKISKPLDKVVDKPASNQDLAEKQNLEKLKKSLKELIIEQKGGSINSKKIKTFSL